MSLLQAYELLLHNRPGDSAFSAFPNLAYNKLLLFSGRYGAFDAHVLAKYNDHWITSPKVDYIPQPFIFKGARVEPLCDGHMGHIDCFQWPQLHAEHYIWSTCIPWKFVYHDDPTWKWMWWNVSQSVEDFVLERGSAFKVGRIHMDKWKLLEAVYNLLDGCVQEWILKYPQYDGPLKQLPFTFRDTVILVTFCQCLCLDIFGMLEYLETVLPPATGTIIEGFNCWMGAFTTDPKVCQQHFKTHIPVWLIWKPDCVPEDMKVLKEVDITCPDNIITDPEDFEVRQVLKWMGGWCYPSEACHLHTQSGPVVGLEQFACPWPETSVQGSSGTVASTLTSMARVVSNGASSSGANLTTGAIRVDRPGQHTQPYPPARLRPKAKPSATPNAKLWEDVNDPAIPPTMATWHSALQNMNKDLKRVCPNMPKIAYFFPHPSLFVRAANLFGLKLVRVQHEVPSHIQFWDISISLEDLASIDQLMKSKVLWDLFKHNFWFELVTLGHVLMSSMPLDQESEWLNCACQVFPGDSELTMCAEPFLSEDQGLGSSDPQSKHEYVEKLQDLLAPWPGLPSDLMAPLLPLALSACDWVTEKKLAVFYMQSFFDNFGQPPILPHFIPVPSAYHH
ncbi:hypothetical protein F5141DRAFT_1065039 [Pisolithus sp. B1]|nr:hypothetical protein F5141DRAFT_1065039 [Pisolithus sp. B1]